MSSEIRSKNIHVKLDKKTHTRFKTGLIVLGVSMQEAFEEFAKRVADGDKSAVNIVERMVRTRVKQELAEVGLKPGLGRRRRVLDELDQDVLYDLINEGEQGDEAALPVEG